MTHSHSPLTAPLAKARGLGSAKEGVSHWWWQRVTAALLVPLLIWFMCALLNTMVGASRSGVAEWFGSPLNAIGTAAMLLALFYHSKLGLQVVIEDYIHCHCKKLCLLAMLNIAAFLLAVISIVAVLKLHIIGI